MFKLLTELLPLANSPTLDKIVYFTSYDDRLGEHGVRFVPQHLHELLGASSGIKPFDQQDVDGVLVQEGLGL